MYKPNKIVAVLIPGVFMPNGEIIVYGKTVGWNREFELNRDPEKYWGMGIIEKRSPN